MLLFTVAKCGYGTPNWKEYLIIPVSLLLINWFFQKVLRLNGRVPWPVHFTSRVSSPEKIVLGRNVAKSFAVSGGCYVQAINGIEIGDDSIFAPGVKLISANHSRKNLGSHLDERSLVIGKSVWIGANAVILPGICIGDNATIAAGAVVVNDVPSDAVIAGVPGKEIKRTKTSDSSDDDES